MHNVLQSDFARAFSLTAPMSLIGHGKPSNISIRPTLPITTTTTTTRFQTHCVQTDHALLNRSTSRDAKNGPIVLTDTVVNAVVTVKLLESSPDDHPSSSGTGRLLLQLFSTELDQSTGLEKTVISYAKKGKQGKDEVEYVCSFQMPRKFGKVGAVLVENEYQQMMFISTIVLSGPSYNDGLSLTINCNSHVSSLDHDLHSRAFFTNKSYLPSQTPSGLKRLRQMELESLRGNGTGECTEEDRIYDYALYNDLGNPDQSPELARPTLGGPLHPYPRRCRTGRGPAEKDPSAEKSTSKSIYVPRDEAFMYIKQSQFNFKLMLLKFIPSIVSSIDPKSSFPSFTAIDNLFIDGVQIPSNKILRECFPSLVKASPFGTDIVTLPTPELINRDLFSWLTDEEFARETLAGINPYSIQLVTEWPMMSKLDPNVYGPWESAITKELVEREIKGIMTVEEALEKKRLFIIDYHDLLLPYVNKVREQEDSILYGSRTLFFLRDNSTLQPVAIELTRPPSDDKPQWNHVFTPSSDHATNCWLWRFAKLHALVNDSAYHQLVAHWLRTHCCTEPYIIAANRQLSAMHPIYRLLHPYFRYTMEINAFARKDLINAGGAIENNFSAKKYCMEISSVAYDLLWRFDMEAAPADLIRRGLAVEDPKAKHGVKLTIEDHPFANDALILWDTIKQWVSDYVNHYYPENSLIANDKELQDWWTEVRTIGHADKKDEQWWPVLNTHDDLIEVLSTIIWVSSGQHAAVNFGQYPYAAYFPNRPTIARTNMPNEDPIDEEKYNEFLIKPENALLECLPSQIQAVTVMVVLNVLSTHSPDEEYVGGTMEPSWAENPVINAAFVRFSGRLMELTGIIDGRNLDPKLLNRSGVGIVPYELLRPFSDSGVSGKGVPNSISI